MILDPEEIRVMVLGGDLKCLVRYEWSIRVPGTMR
jgi:hypothetical protein